jgi:hypothetical protein
MGLYKMWLECTLNGPLQNVAGMYLEWAFTKCGWNVHVKFVLFSMNDCLIDLTAPINID